MGLSSESCVGVTLRRYYESDRHGMIAVLLSSTERCLFHAIELQTLLRMQEVQRDPEAIKEFNAKFFRELAPEKLINKSPIF